MTKDPKHARTTQGKSRTETDSFGSIEIPATALWGAQTQRSLEFFAIGDQALPRGFIVALIQIKKACSKVNTSQGRISAEQGRLITRACDQLLAASQGPAQAPFTGQFPVSVWQTGSGTQSNMNVNEVVANLANSFVGKGAGSKSPVHPNDHVNCSQSSNDVFPTAMHIYAVELLQQNLLPELNTLRKELHNLERRWAQQLIAGRTHMMDALPLTLGQVMGGYRYQVERAQQQIEAALNGLLQLAIGGTAVGTGANAPKRFDREVCAELAQQLQREFVPHANKFAALSSQDELLTAAHAVSALAAVLQKLANDIRLLGSGPNTAFGELQLPANEPGSSIMPGKVNPTQCEALTMVCIQAIVNGHAIESAVGQGQLQLNTYRPLMVKNFAEAVTLLADAMGSFTRHCLAGLEVNTATVERHLQANLMLVTFAAPEVGYDNASKIARYAAQHGGSIYAAAEALDIMPAGQLQQLVEARVRATIEPG
ncbi:MAG: class II fumarate hydratase [Gammaproteobacteria bacterium]|nr:class II fumarate hydratase [Gammaproteobacteria bacterium]